MYPPLLFADSLSKLALRQAGLFPQFPKEIGDFAVDQGMVSLRRHTADYPPAEIQCALSFNRLKPIKIQELLQDARTHAPLLARRERAACCGNGRSYCMSTFDAAITPGLSRERYAILN